MPSELEFTGERFVPGTAGEIAHEHWHRYAFARRFVAGRSVCDIACGEGYGSALLGTVAGNVVGIDIDADTIAHAAREHAAANVAFLIGSAAQLPLADASVDAVVSFETIEHLPAELQPVMLREFARVLRPDGFVVLSSPNRPEYSDGRGHRNPFHLHELDRDELMTLLDGAFPARRWFRQRRYLGSALWSEDGGPAHEMLSGDALTARTAAPPEALYFVVVAARAVAALPPVDIGLSLFTDADGREWARLDAQAREVLRLDALLKTRDQALDRQAGHIAHLEELIAYRERIVAERDAQLAQLRAELGTLARERAETREALAARTTDLASAQQALQALDAERERLERAIAAQERIIAYRQSARWWMQLPLLRVRNLWHKVANT